MANEKLTARDEALTAADDDVLHVVDVSDNAVDPDGNSKKIQVANLMLSAPVQSVAGKDGDVTLTTSDVAEGSNLYHTTARVNNVIAASSVTAHTDVSDAGSGQIVTTAERTSWNTAATTAATNEANIATYYAEVTGDIAALDTRVTQNEADIAANAAAIPTNLTDLNDTPVGYGTAGQVLATNSTADGTEWVTPVSGGGAVDSVNGQTGVVTLDTDDISEGTNNLYYTEARVSANTNVAANTSKLANIAEGAEVNVNADWNAVSGDAQILNKPSLAAVATSGAYGDLSGTPTIPTALSDLTGDTGDVTEGTNLYYTDTRVATYLASQNISASYPTTTLTGSTLLTSAHEQKMLLCNSAAGFTIQIPTGLERDAEVLVYQEGAGGITITAGTGVTLRNTSGFQNITAEQYAIVGLKQLGTTDVWVITGERKAV